MLTEFVFILGIVGICIPIFLLGVTSTKYAPREEEEPIERKISK